MRNRFLLVTALTLLVLGPKTLFAALPESETGFGGKLWELAEEEWESGPSDKTKAIAPLRDGNPVEADLNLRIDKDAKAASEPASTTPGGPGGESHPPLLPPEGEEGFVGPPAPEPGAPDGGEEESTGVKKYPLSYYGPMSGFGHTMLAPAYSTQAANLLSSPMAVLFTTWNLTEPGVAAGMNAAMTQANFALQQRYAAEAQLARQNDYWAEVGVRNMANYYSCIHNQLAGKDSAEGGKPGAIEKVSWIAAQDKCLYDEDPTKEAAAGEEKAETFNEPDETTAKPEDNVNNDTARTSGGGGGAGGEGSCNEISNAYKWLATRVVFLEGVDRDSPEWDRLRHIASSFRTYIGDAVVCQVGKDGKDPINDPSPQIRIEFKPPSDERYTGDEALYMREVFTGLVRDRYYSLMGLLRKKCEREAQGITATDFQPFDTLSIWEEVDEKEFAHNYMVGFKINAFILDILYDFVMRKHVEDLNNLRCDERFNPDNGDSAFKTLINSENANTVKDEYRAIYITAKKIALGQLLMVFIKAEEHILKSLSSAVSDYSHQALLKVLYKRMPADSLTSAYQLNLESLRDFLEEVRVMRANESGSGGRALSSPFKGDSDTQSGAPGGGIGAP